MYFISNTTTLSNSYCSTVVVVSASTFKLISTMSYNNITRMTKFNVSDGLSV